MTLMCLSFNVSYCQPMPHFGGLLNHFSVSRIMRLNQDLVLHELLLFDENTLIVVYTHVIEYSIGLEGAMRRWKQRLGPRALDIGCEERLTNIRYADDLLVFAMSWQQLVCMMEILIEELAAIGLQLNTSKTKIVTAQRQE